MSDFAVGEPLQNGHHPFGQFFVVHRHGVVLQDVHFGLRFGALRDFFSDAPDVCDYPLLHLKIEAADRAVHRDFVGHDVRARIALDGPDSDDGRGFGEIGPATHDRLQGRDDRGGGGDWVDRVLGHSTVPLLANDCHFQRIATRCYRAWLIGDLTKRSWHDMLREYGIGFALFEEVPSSINLAPQLLPEDGEYTLEPSSAG